MNTRSGLRTIPVRPVPEDGESFAGYVLRLADGMDLSPLEAADYVGVADGRPQAPVPGLVGAVLDTARVAAAAYTLRLTEGAVRAMLLNRWFGTLLPYDEQAIGSRLTRQRLVGEGLALADRTRACTACLAAGRPWSVWWPADQVRVPHRPCRPDRPVRPLPPAVARLAPEDPTRMAPRYPGAAPLDGLLVAGRRYPLRRAARRDATATGRRPARRRAGTGRRRRHRRRVRRPRGPRRAPRPRVAVARGAHRRRHRLPPHPSPAPRRRVRQGRRRPQPPPLHLAASGRVELTALAYAWAAETLGGGEAEEVADRAAGRTGNLPNRVVTWVTRGHPALATLREHRR